MKNQQESSYPFCYKCNNQLNPKNSRGWEKFKDIFICPSCIEETQIYKEMKERYKYEWERKVLTAEGLEDWKIRYSEGGGLCMRSTRTIYCLKNDKALFLHEVAHALTPKSKDKTGHDSIWADKYTDLFRKYNLGL